MISRVKIILNQWLCHDSTVRFAVELFRIALKKVSIFRLLVSNLVEKCPVKAVEIILSCEENLTKDAVEELH